MSGRSGHSRQQLSQSVAPVVKSKFPFFPSQARWKSADDRTVGGRSLSCLDIEAGTIRFWGRLDCDTKTGIGQAAQTYPFVPRVSLPTETHSGLLLSLLPSSLPPAPVRRPSDETHVETRTPTRLTIVLESEETKFTKDGRKEEAVQWMFSLDALEVWEENVEKQSFFAREQVCTLSLPFSSFSPSLGGFPLRQPPTPFRPDNITSLSLSVRSIGPGDQEGTFEFIVAGLEGMVNRPPPRAKNESTRDI